MIVSIVGCMIGFMFAREYWLFTPSSHHNTNQSRYRHQQSHNSSTINQRQDSFLEQAHASVQTFLIENPYFDTEHDESIHKFVGPYHSYEKAQYQPSNLVIIDSPYIATTQTTMKLRQDAFEALHQLGQEFYDIFDKKIVIVSSHRSYTHQQRLSAWCSSNFCAKPWHSEHQWGWAIDIFFVDNKENFLSKQAFKEYFERMLDNAHRYGYHNSYQKWVAIDGYYAEPRHRRYIGIPLATELHEQWITFTERHQQHRQ